MVKRLSDQANIASVRLAEQSGNPPTPPSGFGYLYEKTDGGIYFINDGGSVVGPLSSNPVLMTGTVTYVSNVQTIQLQDGLSVAVTGSVAFVKSGIGALTTWVPTVIQSGTLSKTIFTAFFQKIGNVVYVCATMQVTQAGVAGNDITIGNLPFTINSPQEANDVVGFGYILDVGASYYVGTAYRSGPAAIKFVAHLETNDIGTDPSFALASGDQITFQLMYPVA